jgi:hypothetical protein
LVVTAALGSYAPAAQADPHQVCLYLDLGDGYWDASPRAADGEEFGEEYGRNEGPHSYPAQRWLARVRDDTTGTIVFGWSALDGNGCAAFDLPPSETALTVEWVRWAIWNDAPETGNQLVGYRCDAAMSSCTIDQDIFTLPANMATGVTEIVAGTKIVDEIDLIFWAATFAEERFAALGDQPLDDTFIYVGHDPQDVLPGATQADRTFGNQPSVVVDGNAWHSKFTIAHELGHQQTLAAQHPTFGPTSIDYCYDPSLYPVVPAGCTPNHTMDSHEWQAAAAIEGIAHWYAVSVWNDVDIIECQNCGAGVRYVAPSAADVARSYRVPRVTPLCTALNAPQCPAGVSNEWDWLSAFRLFRLGAASTPSFRTMLTMVSAAYSSGNWVTSGPTDGFWTSFDQAMVGHLGNDHAAWQAAAGEMALDR